MKRISFMILTATLILAFMTGCQQNGNSEQPPTEVYEKYQTTFFSEPGSELFNTTITVVGYAKSEDEFKNYMEILHARMLGLHKLYDKYNDYEGINNIKTINDYAGVKPVEVSKDLIDLILFCKKQYEEIGEKTNIAMGSVLKIWHDYREEGKDNPDAKIPPMDKLLEAREHTDINKVIVDVENSTVYLDDPLMSLDVGAVAKGYATELAVQEIMREGFTSGIISSGGNIRAFGQPMDGIRDKWGVGIQDPDVSSYADASERNLDVIFLTDASVVTSGDYDRFYKVGDMVLHHLIDPDTLMPGDYFRAVTIVTENSGMADFLSTIVFLLPFEEGKELVESLDNTEALWIFKDRTVEATEGMKAIMKSHGATAAIKK